MTASLHLGLWQASGTAGDVAANLADVARVAGQSAAAGIDLLVFPECFLTGYFTQASVQGIAAQVTDAVMAELADIARQTGVGLVVGSYQPGADGVRNSAFVFTPAGGHVGTYAKRMLYGAWEKSVFRPGDAPYLFDCNGFRVGVLICYDIEFPERARELAVLGADLIVTPTALMSPYVWVPQVIVPARAIENHLFVAYANRIGRDGAHVYPGLSRIAGPRGAILAEAGAAEALVCARLDLKVRQAVRADYDYLGDLRP